MSVNIRFPNINGASEAEQLSQIKSYLYQLVEQLNWVLSTDVYKQGVSKDITDLQQSVEELKQIINSMQ
jgi:hypothetical protein